MSGNDPTPAAPRGDGCIFAILMIIGIVLVLPGVCGLAVLAGMAEEVFNDGGILILVLVSIATGVGGVILLGRARRMAGYPERRNQS